MNLVKNVAQQDVKPILHSTTEQSSTGDYWISNLGSVVVITPITDKARSWLEANVAFEPWQQFGQGIAIDNRLVTDIDEGMHDAGLVRQ